MRKWHRWLSVVFGVFALFIAVTGVLSHVADIYAGEGQSPARALVRTLHHLHSGETFGPVGVAISIATGIALIFFAGSGIWMYVDMFRRRARGRAQRGLRRWFW